MTDFNLEKEYGWILDGIDNYIESNADQFLAHHGVKGQKWGVRKARQNISELKGLGPDSITHKTKLGDEITISKKPAGAIHKILGAMSSKFRNHYNNGAFFTIKDANGKTVGDAMVQKRNAEELDLMWVGIKGSQRGKGYAQAVMKAAEEFGRQSGFKKMTLEVPGNSPDARHIYEKLGFKDVGKVEGSNEHDTWGGLTKMEYVFSTAKHVDSVEAFLEHQGVKGMKWGRRTGSIKKAKTRTRTPEEIKKAKARRDMAITVGLGAAMLASMALSTTKVSSIDAKAKRKIDNDFSDVMGLPMSSIKLNYNPSHNTWE